MAKVKPPWDPGFDSDGQREQAVPPNFSVAVPGLESHRPPDAFDELLASVEAFESLSQDPVAGNLFDIEQPSPSQIELQDKATDLDGTSGFMDASEMALSNSQPDSILGPQISLDLPFDMTQMGYRGFKDMRDRGPILRDEHGNQVRTSNSPFSDHLGLVEHLLSQKWQKLAPGREPDPRRYVLYHPQPPETRNMSALTMALRISHSLQNAVSFMISTFTCLSWQMMTTFFAHTRAHQGVVHVTSWHLHPDPQIYSKIDPWYRATQIQLTVPHPVVIDWVPYPWLRDRLIIFHASNPRLDEIICEVADCYAAEVDLSNLVVGATPCLAFLRVFDTITAISNDQDTGTASSYVFPDDPATARAPIDTPLPAPSITALFRNKSLALQAFHMLSMDRRQGLLKLDPVFFERHPELYDQRAESLIARGIAVRPPPSAGGRAVIPTPRPLDPKTLTKYIDMAKWAYDFSVPK